MGKRVKKKAQSALKEKRVPNSSTKDVLKENNHTSKISNDGVVAVKERKVCAHFENAVDVAKVCSKLGSAESTGCEDCREGMIDRKGGKGKGKHGKKKSGTKATWICLQCGHFSCGGVGLPNSEQTHAARHSSQNRHPLVIQLEKNKLRWCFSCRALIPVQTLDDNGDLKDALSDIVKVLKKQSYKTTSVDVEDIWFGSGSVISDVKSENKVVSLPNGKDLFAIRGLVNLGNTCFFNSVMQNLLAIDILREYLLSFDGSMGPMTSALKKIYIETSLESGLRNAINPKPLFECIYAKASQFRSFQQQDSHELLRCLLDGLSAEDLRAKKSDIHSREIGPSLSASPTFIDVIFGGQISSTVCCVECGHSSVVHEPFLDLSLPLPTKKPHPKKPLPASRTRKAKQPPKRVGRPRPKLIKEENLGSVVIGCHPSSSSQSSSADLIEPVLVVDNKVLGSQENNSTQPACAQVPESGGQEVDVVRLDCPEPVTQSDAQEADSLLEFLEPVTQSDAPESDSWLDFFEPVSLSDDQNLTVEKNDVLDSLESGSKDGNHNISSMQETANSSEQIGVDTGDKNMKPQSVVDGWEDDCPIQVKDNEVLLLPYFKEDCPATEIPSLAVGDEEDTSDFVGFGDMFDEPEAVATTSEVSNNMEGSSHLGNGFLAGNSTESDPDEVDNTDSQVSVESCLAHFVKPELLSGEHAWHCENCSKLQLKKRRKLKMNHVTSSLVHQKNMSINECSGTNSVFVADSNGNTGPSENLKNHIPVQANGLTSVLSKELGEICEAESACPDATSVSISPQLPDEASLGSKSINCCTVYADHIPVETPSGSEEHDSEEDKEDDDIDSKSVKVMRSATKRILISKSPAILTIHLKRFGQDARGRLSKLSGHVVFKEFIDLRPYLDNRSVGGNCIYRLIGVVEHSGSMKSGHYVAYVRGTDTRRGRSDEQDHTQRHNVWYHASDSYVRETTLNEVLHSEAYILFYEKVHL